MSQLDLFTDLVPEERQHPIYKMLKKDEYLPERRVINEWAQDFVDRDNKFTKEFQTSFEPCLWELYLHIYLKKIGLTSDFSYDAPDFVVRETEFCIEATVALPPNGAVGTRDFSLADLPTEFNKFNSESSIRISNSFVSKVRKLRERYSELPQCIDKPFVIAIASFDRPFAHFAASRPILATLYGLYYDEDNIIASNSDSVISYRVNSAIKNENVEINMGLFCSPEFADVSAVIYSSLVTWGKIRALADNPLAPTVYTTFTPRSDSLFPEVKTTLKCDYREDLLDGLYVLHNPFANHKLPLETLRHPRIAQGFIQPNGTLDFEVPEDFLLLRYLTSITAR